MAIVEAQRFYEQDLKKYDISKNKEFLLWLKELSKNGYHAFINIEQLQELIDNIVIWYEIKYPEREMKFSDETMHYNIENMDNLSNEMDIRYLTYRLSDNQRSLMECNYRSNGSIIDYMYDDKGEIVESLFLLSININRNEVKCDSAVMCSDAPNFYIYAHNDSGKVDIDYNYNLKKYINADNIILDDLLVLFKEKYDDELDFTELEKCIYHHNCDIELRRRILQLAALKLLYSRNTIPEIGYERAKRFINEFNEKMNLNLSTKEIDEAINRDYTTDKKIKHVLKIYIDKDGEIISYWSIENVAKKEKKSLEKTKKIVKSLFKK